MVNINITLPTCWQELTPSQLRYVFFLLSENYSAEQVKTFCFCRFGNFQIIEHTDNDLYLVKYEQNTHLITAQQIAEQLTHLSWLDDLPLVPIRLPYIGKHHAAPADLAGVPFSDYLACDNLYQGYLQTQRNDLLQEIASILYHAPSISLNDEELISVFYWFASLKAYYSRRFSHLYSTTPDTNLLANSQSTQDRLQSAMDNQIRALTKGDITKETEVLNTDTLRALTELNALAREYQELQNQSKL